MRAKGMAFAILGVLLFWLVAKHTLAAYLATVNPAAALWLNPRQSTALVALVNAEVNGAPPPSSPASPTVENTASNDRITQWANAGRRATERVLSRGEPGDGSSSAAASAPPPRDAQAAGQSQARALLALESDPLNAKPLRLLGQLADAAGDKERASALMRAAMRRSLRESVAVYWLMQESLERNDYHAAVNYADILLRTRVSAARVATAALARAAENKDGAEALKALLAKNPPWRAKFFAALPQSITDARTPLGLLISLKQTPSPPAASELSPYIKLLIERKFYDLAYYTWLQFLPAEQLSRAGFLFNGSFESTPSGLPFDWVFKAGPGVSVEIVERQEQAGGHALQIEFDQGRVDFGGATQLLALPPGDYQLRGNYKGNVIGKRGLVWRIWCADKPNARLAETQMQLGADANWRSFELDFTVPASDCPAQYVRLDLDARSASERLVSGIMMYDGLQVSRAVPR